MIKQFIIDDKDWHEIAELLLKCSTNEGYCKRVLLNFIRLTEKHDKT